MLVTCMYSKSYGSRRITVKVSDVTGAEASASFLLTITQV